MAEIKQDLIHLKEGESYTAKENDYVITDKHTLNDILRFAISCSNKEEIRYLANELTQQDKE